MDCSIIVNMDFSKMRLKNAIPTLFMFDITKLVVKRLIFDGHMLTITKTEIMHLVD